ncbi:MAG: prohibitin family protein [Rhodocyclaceae bacterium]|nr:prohibitin family protein [Rhodocyclaceae bacterium]
MTDEIAGTNKLNELSHIAANLARAIGSAGVSLGNELMLQRRKIIALSVIAMGAYAAYQQPPMQSVERGQAALRINRITGTIDELHEGANWVIPGLHDLRRFSLRDQTYRSGESENGTKAQFQSVEGLAIGVDISVRFNLDPHQIAAVLKNVGDNLSDEVVGPAAQDALYKTLARYTVREIFSSKREEIQKIVETEVKATLLVDGIKVQAVTIGKIDLPADYKRGMEQLLSEELASEKMRYTLELKDKQVKQTELEAQADKVRREKSAEAAGEEQIIAARAQAEAMKHVLPFKQKQIEQRSLEAEAEKVTRIKIAEASSQARQIEATGEAESRRKLADAEIYRQDKIGKLISEQMARDGALLSKHPLLIQKSMVDKLSDKISVIIAPPSTDGGFIGNALLGNVKSSAKQANAAADEEGSE